MLTHTHNRVTVTHTSNKEMSEQWLGGIVSLSLWCYLPSPLPLYCLSFSVLLRSSPFFSRWIQWSPPKCFSGSHVSSLLLTTLFLITQELKILSVFLWQMHCYVSCLSHSQQTGVSWIIIQTKMKTVFTNFLRMNDQKWINAVAENNCHLNIMPTLICGFSPACL